MERLTTPDVELLERAREYDAQALAEIYDRYAESIYRYLCRYVGDAAHAEDLTGEVFLKLLQVVRTRRAPRDRLQGWLYRVAHNLAMDWFRQRGKGATLSLEEEWISGADPPSTVIEKNQARQQLRAAICQLTADQQQVILLRFGEGLRLADVSRLMDKSEGAVKILQHRAVQRLRKLLDREERS
jgi:RNA polymerase sigma-70 factor (ECF subfamily)